MKMLLFHWVNSARIYPSGTLTLTGVLMTFVKEQFLFLTLTGFLITFVKE